jgi:hypothetical protein
MGDGAAEQDARETARDARRAYARRRQLHFLLCFGPPFLYLFVFMILPYATMFQYSFWKKSGYFVVPELNIDNYLRFFDNPLYLNTLIGSLEVALIVTLFANLVGYPLAYFLAFVASRHRQLLYFLIIIPLWASFLLRVFIWKLILGREGIVNSFLEYAGIIDEPLSLILYNRFSVCLTLVYIFIPFVALPRLHRPGENSPQLRRGQHGPRRHPDADLPPRDPATEPARRAGREHLHLQPELRRFRLAHPAWRTDRTDDLQHHHQPVHHGLRVAVRQRAGGRRPGRRPDERRPGVARGAPSWRTDRLKTPRWRAIRPAARWVGGR